MGSSSTGNYAPQITQALNQANQPKSALAQQFSGSIQGSYLSALSQLLNAGSLGNAFPGLHTGAVTPGMQFNQNPTGFTNTSFNPNLIPQLGAGSNGATPPVNGTPGLNPGTNIGPEPQNPVGPYTGKMNDANAWLQQYGLNPQSFQNQKSPSGKGSYSIGDLVSSGQLTRQAAYQSLGIPANYNPATDPGQQADYNAWKNSYIGQNQNLDINQWFDQYGPLGSSVSAQSPDDPQEYQSYLDQVKSKSPAPGNIDNSGNYVIPDTNPADGVFLTSGNFVDAKGNIIGPGPTSGNPGQGGGQGGMSDLASLIQQLSSANPSQSLLSNPNFNQQYFQMGGTGISGLAGVLQNQLTQTQNLTPGGAKLNLNGAPTVNPATADLSSVSGQINPNNDPYYQGVVSTLQNSLNQQRADLRARFGAGGGTSRGTPASFAESQFDAQTIPQLAATLGQAQQQSIGNTLQQRNQEQTGLLANAQNTNTVNLANAGNILQEQNQGNQALLGGQGNFTNSLSSLGNLFTTNQGQQLQNYFNTIGANQNQNSLLGQVAGQAGGINSGLLGQITGANQQQIQNQMSGLQNILQIAAALSGAGIPGGSANVSLGGNSQSNVGALGQLGSALGSLAGLFG